MLFKNESNVDDIKFNKEMKFMLSITNGLSEFDDRELWAKSAGASRGMRVAYESVKGLTVDQAKQELSSKLEESVETFRSDEPLVMADDRETQKSLGLGYIFALVHAIRLVDGERDPMYETQWSEEALTESFKYNPNQEQLKVNNVSS